MQPQLRLAWSLALVATAALAAVGCRGARAGSEPPAALPPVQKDRAAPEKRILRITGIVQAVKSRSIRVPQLSGQSSRLTLVRLIPNGSKVNEGDLLAEFDRTDLLDQERDAAARLQDLQHQLAEKRAQVNSDQARRASALGEALADLDKALIQLKKGPVLSDIERMKAEARATGSRQRVESLKKSDAARRKAEEAAVGILELKVKRQTVVLERVRSNMARLEIRAPQNGMVALENSWRSGSMGPPQEGDQMWAGQALVRIFDPTAMVVDAMVNEPDIAAAGKAVTAKVFVDAYPSLVLDATLETSSPVATAALESPVRTFNTRFRIQQQDSRLLPDLSASLEVPLGERAAPPAAGSTPEGAAR